MSIIRAARPQSNFYILDKTISEDPRLSWGARGLLVFLLGKPDHWRVSTQALVNQTEASRIHAGRDSVRALLGELIDTGYASRLPRRGEGGKLEGYDYFVSETPNDACPAASPATDYPAPVEPATAGPATDQPASANPPLVSTDSKQALNGSKKSTSMARPDDVPDDVWADFLKLRKLKKAEVTNTALKAMRSQAEQAGITLADAMVECCARGWTGFRAEWMRNRNGNAMAVVKPNGGLMNKQEALEARNAEVARRWAEGE